MPALWAYFDTSVLVKRYVNEVGSLRARGLFRRYRLITSVIAPIEIISALYRRRAMSDVSGRDFSAIRARLMKDRAYWELAEMSPLVLSQAEELIQRTTLRTLDALHVATAVTFQALSGHRVPFITADQRQREAAEQLKLHVEWVG